MEAEKQLINDNIRLLMKHHGDTQTTIGTALGMSQPQVSLRLRVGPPPEAVDWKVAELAVLADYFGIPFEKLFQARAVVQRWIGEQLIDLSGHDERVSWWDSEEQSDDLRLPVAS